MRWIPILMLLLSLPGLGQESIRFKPGDTTGQVKGALRGDQIKEYRFQAQAGQTFRLQTRSDRPQWLLLSLSSPGSETADVFTNYVSGEMSGEGVLPSDGEYILRYLIRRPEARRGGQVSYDSTLEILPLGEGAFSSKDLWKGKGTYRVGTFPPTPIQGVHLELQQDGEFRLGVDLSGDGFIVEGTYRRLGGGVSLAIERGFDDARLMGEAVILLDSSGKPLKMHGHFFFPRQKTVHVLSFPDHISAYR